MLLCLFLKYLFELHFILYLQNITCHSEIKCLSNKLISVCQSTTCILVYLFYFFLNLKTKNYNALYFIFLGFKKGSDPGMPPLSILK